MLEETADAMGASVTEAGFRVMAADLSHLEDLQIKTALAAIRRESKSSNGFAPKLVLGDILEKAGLVMGAEAESVQAVAAWDLAVETAGRFARCMDGSTYELRPYVHAPVADCEHCFGSGQFIERREGIGYARRCECIVSDAVPELPARLVGSVARQGGWGKFKDVPPEAHPFRRRDFIAEYLRWAKVEDQIEPMRRLGAASLSSVGSAAGRLMAELQQPRRKVT